MNSRNVFEAAAAGDTEYLKQHLQSLKEKNERGWTVLHFAARYGQRDAVELLLSNGVDRNTLNEDGKTAAQVAQSWGYEDIAKLLRAPSDIETPSIAEPSGFPSNQTNFFAGSALNRYGWVRNDVAMLRKLLTSPSAKYILLSKLDPLFDAEGLFLANYEDVASIVEGCLLESREKTPAAAEDERVLVFLGIDERDGQGIHGMPYWALDVTPRGRQKDTIEQLVKGFEARGLEFAPALPRAFTLDRGTASVLAQARAMGN
ncbi:hypothetical protein BX666DRAFT_721946 [Dichotomocladium elegans]|nr:hypothetical protein BX666DRAFT_721946 [Dichotomocladium elegans]